MDYLLPKLARDQDWGANSLLVRRSQEAPVGEWGCEIRKEMQPV